MAPDNAARLREVLRLIVDETTADVDRFDGQPFDGKTVAAYFANQAAAIVALAKAVNDLLPPAEPDRPAHPAVRRSPTDHVDPRDLG